MELRDFYLITPMDFEGICAREAQNIWPFLKHESETPEIQAPRFRTEPGGVSFQAPLSLGLQLNFWARGAVRLLLRVSHFPARSMRELRAQIEKLDLKPFGHVEKLKLSVTVRKSKMSHGHAVQESLERQFKRAGYNLVKDEECDLHLFVRVFKDECQISVDSSGAPLFQRGYKKHSTAAPLRENLAHLLLSLMKGQDDQKAWNWPCLIDPMAGSGSFLFEAAGFFEPISTSRQFHFQNWLCCPESLKPRMLRSSTKHQSPFSQIQGYDIDELALAALEANRIEFLKLIPHKSFEAAKKRDLFEGGEVGELKKPRWIIVNPPYNHRLSIDQSEGDYYNELISKLIHDFDPQRIGILLPARIKNLREIEGFKISRAKSFKNGGLAVQFWFCDKL